jgi:hypothetical protein
MGSVGRPRRLLLSFLALTAAAALLCCEKKGDPVRLTLDRLVKAAHDRNADRFVENLSTDFSGQDGMTRAEALLTVKRYFAAYAILDVTLSDVTVERAENAARVRLTADLSGQPQKVGGLEGLLPRSSRYRFELRLVPEGSRFRIAWASWEPAD